MKKLNLNDTWKLCLQMWRWIKERIAGGSTLRVHELKAIWIKDHEFGDTIKNNCFFCHYTCDELDDDEVCIDCPAREIDPDFSCTDDDYWYSRHSIQFYEKIAELDKIRLKGKSGK